MKDYHINNYFCNDSNNLCNKYLDDIIYNQKKEINKLKGIINLKCKNNSNYYNNNYDYNLINNLNSQNILLQKKLE